LGKTAIFVTHDVREALMLASRIALLRDGMLELLATPREFLEAGGAEARAFQACLDWKVDPPMNPDLAERDPATHAALEHLTLVLVSMAAAIALAVPAGILITRRAAWRPWLLGFANVMQTIPSLALIRLSDSRAADRRHRQAHGHRGAGALRAAPNPAQYAWWASWAWTPPCASPRWPWG
jgi:hypothetical protein